MPTTTEVSRLTVAEKLQLIQELWASIPDDSSELPLPEEHARILFERLKARRENPGRGEPWDVVKQRILSKS